MARLVQTLPTPHSHSLHGPTVIGRAAEADITAPDPRVSKAHCVVEPFDEGWRVRDLGSRNGTMVNGTRVASVALVDQDEIAVGTFKVKFLTRDPDIESVQVAEVDGSRRIAISISAGDERAFLTADRLDAGALATAYDKLRIAHELSLELGVERSLEALFHKLLKYCAKALPVERGAVMIAVDKGWTAQAVYEAKNSDDRIVVSRTVLARVRDTHMALLIDDAATDASFSAARSIQLSGARSLLAVPIVTGGAVRAVILIENMAKSGAFGEQDLVLLTGIARHAALAVERSDLVRRLEVEAENRAYLGRFLAPAVLEQVASGQVGLDLRRSVRRQVVVLYSDMRGFTAFSESAGPEETVEMLNEMFEVLVESVFAYGGVLDKFIGDAVMAMWGAPLARPDDVERALACGLDMMVRVEMLNQRRIAAGLSPIRIGVGVNAGEALVGAIGSSRRMDYTAIGDTVNLASRLKDLAAAGEVLTTAETLARAPGLAGEERGTVHVKNRTQGVELRRVIGPT